MLLALRTFQEEPYVFKKFPSMVFFRLVTEVYHQVFANSKPSVFLFAGYCFLHKVTGAETAQGNTTKGDDVIKT